MANKFLPDNYDENIEDQLFDEEWYNKVSDAINYTFEILEKDNNRIVANKDSLIKGIINWNIEKRLNEKLSEVVIPKTLDWSKATSIQIFDEFSSLVCLCNKNEKIKKHTIKIKCTNNKNAIEQFEFWKRINNEEDNGIIISNKIQKNNTIVCIIEKRAMNDK